MPKQSRTQPESSNMVRVSPYPLRSSRTNKHKDHYHHSPNKSELENIRCVICMEPPHNAVLLTCSSYLKGCRPYMCDTSARHSNCFKEFRTTSYKTKDILDCPLCRGFILTTRKMTRSARRFMNAKPRSCPVDDCEFSGTYTQLDKHSKNTHRGLIPLKVDPQRQWRWEQLARHADFVELISAVDEMVNHHELPYNHPPVFRLDIVNGIVRRFIGPGPRNGSGAIGERRWIL